jgi:hypothetical protein
MEIFNPNLTPPHTESQSHKGWILKLEDFLFFLS